MRGGELDLDHVITADKTHLYSLGNLTANLHASLVTFKSQVVNFTFLNRTRDAGVDAFVEDKLCVSIFTRV